MMTILTYFSKSSCTGTASSRCAAGYISVSYDVAPNMIGGKVTKVSASSSAAAIIIPTRTVDRAAFRFRASRSSLDSEMAVSCGNKAENQKVNNESIMVVVVIVSVCHWTAKQLLRPRQTSMSFRKHHEGQNFIMTFF